MVSVHLASLCSARYVSLFCLHKEKKGLAAAESAQTEAIPLLEMVLAKVASRKACISNRANMVEPCLPTYALEL